MATIEIFPQKLHVKNYFTGENVTLNKLFTCGITLIKFFRSLECPMARVEASDLCRYNQIFDDLGIRLVGITYDKIDQKHFDKNVWSGDLLFDKKRKIYKLLGLIREKKSLRPSTAILNDKEFFSNWMRRTILRETLGATYIINSDGKVLFQSIALKASSTPSLAVLQWIHYYFPPKRKSTDIFEQKNVKRYSYQLCNIKDTKEKKDTYFSFGATRCICRNDEKDNSSPESSFSTTASQNRSLRRVKITHFYA